MKNYITLSKLKKKALQNFILMPVTFWFIFIMIFYYLNTLSEMFHEVFHSSLACICSLTYINHIVAGDLVNDYTEMIELHVIKKGFPGCKEN